MTTTINASTSSGLVQTADTSGILKVQSNGVTTNALAWVNFNGVTTVTVRASYNVSSVTRNATGDYTINFSSALSDANYAVSGICGWDGTSYLFLGQRVTGGQNFPPTTTACRIFTSTTGNTSDSNYVNVTIFGN